MYDQVVERYLNDSINKPSKIWYHEDGSIEAERWYKDGKYVRSSSQTIS